MFNSYIALSKYAQIKFLTFIHILILRYTQ